MLTSKLDFTTFLPVINQARARCEKQSKTKLWKWPQIISQRIPRLLQRYQALSKGHSCLINLLFSRDVTATMLLKGSDSVDLHEIAYGSD